jgi:hypothetical protein
MNNDVLSKNSIGKIMLKGLLVAFGMWLIVKFSWPVFAEQRNNAEYQQVSSFHADKAHHENRVNHANHANANNLEPLSSEMQKYRDYQRMRLIIL